MRNKVWGKPRNILRELRIVELYRAGYMCKEILARVGLGPKSGGWVFEVLRRHNIPLRGYANSSGNGRKYYWDFSFFDRDTPEVAYWAGFIMADGNISPTQHGTYEMRLYINIRDRKHIETFCDHLNLTMDKIREQKRETPFGFSHTCGIVITHPLLGRSLERWGIIPRKTTEYTEPQVPINILPHFLRGWFDGDGSITASKTQQMMYICGHPIAMQWFGDSLLALGYSGTHSIRHEKSWAYFGVGGILQMFQVYHLLHGNEFPRLDRKWSKIELYHSPRLDKLRQQGVT